MRWTEGWFIVVLLVVIFGSFAVGEWRKRG
jgi:predicted nucleotidyltransferase